MSFSWTLSAILRSSAQVNTQRLANAKHNFKTTSPPLDFLLFGVSTRLLVEIHPQVVSNMKKLVTWSMWNATRQYIKCAVSTIALLLSV